MIRFLQFRCRSNRIRNGSAEKAEDRTAVREHSGIGLTSNGFAPANPTRREIPVPLILSFTCVQSPQESHNLRSDAACVRCTMACVHTADNTQSLREQRLRGKHQQTNVFVGNTLTDSQRESVFSATTALVGVILLPLPPITIAATYLRGSVFIRRRYICIFVCRKPCFRVFYSMRSGWSTSFMR